LPAPACSAPRLLGGPALLPGWSGRADLAQAHLHLAAGHARRGGGPGLRSWLHAVAAECLARSGRVADALVQIERARETLAAGGAHDDPWWLDFYDPRRLDGFDAAVGLATAHAVLSRDAAQRDARHARDRVERALRLLPQPAAGPGLTPQDCVTLLDRAIGTALVGDDDGALRLVETAAHPLGRRPYHAAEVRLDDIADVLPARRLTDFQEIERAYLRVA